MSAAIVRPGEFATVSGRWVNVERPSPEDVHLDDIVWALSRICRYGGHIREHYSVAQHSTEVWDYMTRVLAPGDRRLQLAALVHDFSEGYLNDIISPIKHLDLGRYKEFESAWSRAIEKRVGLPAHILEDEYVKYADNVIYWAEDWDLRRGIHSKREGRERPKDAYVIHAAGDSGAYLWLKELLTKQCGVK